MSAANSCPACSTPMSSHPDGEALCCDGCHGLWIELEALANHLAARGVEVPAMTARPPDPEQRLCPICRTPLSPIAMARVPLDRCEAHGVWFDGGELEAIGGGSGARLQREVEPPGKESSGFWSAIKDLLWFGS